MDKRPIRASLKKQISLPKNISRSAILSLFSDKRSRRSHLASVFPQPLKFWQISATPHARFFVRPWLRILIDSNLYLANYGYAPCPIFHRILVKTHAKILTPPLPTQNRSQNRCLSNSRPKQTSQPSYFLLTGSGPSKVSKKFSKAWV